MLRRPTPWFRAALALAGLLLGGTGSAAADVYVVANSPVSLNPEEIKDVFLGEVQFAGPTRLAPVDNGAVQAEFLARVMRMTPTRYGNWWTKKSFRDGVNPPPARAGDAQVSAYVRDTPGAIGYLSSPPTTPGVHVIARFVP